MSGGGGGSVSTSLDSSKLEHSLTHPPIHSSTPIPLLSTQPQRTERITVHGPRVLPQPRLDDVARTHARMCPGLPTCSHRLVHDTTCDTYIMFAAPDLPITAGASELMIRCLRIFVVSVTDRAAQARHVHVSEHG